MLNVVSDLFISNLKKCFFHHKFGILAKLPGRVIFPDPVFCLGKQFFAWHKIRAVWRKEHNHCSRGMSPVNYGVGVVDSRIICGK